jgi:hypothetical protein
MNCRRGWKVVIEAVEVGVFVTLALSVWQTRTSNRIAREAMERNYVPWLTVEKFDAIKETNGNLHVNLIMKDCGASPALHCRGIIYYDLTGTGSSGEMTLMPNQSYVVPVPCPGDKMARAGFEELQAGEVELKVCVQYEDVFGKTYVVTNEWAYAGGTWGNKSYTVGQVK